MLLSVGFISQVIVSCCQCGETFTTEILYNGVRITPYDNAGFFPRVATDTVYKNAFGLDIELNFETQVVENSVGFGFNSALAFQCDCNEYDERIYPDPIQRMEITMEDQESGQDIIVTDLFRIESNDGDFVNLNIFFEQRPEWQDRFRIELADYNSIPDSGVFKAEVFLESGNSFVEQTAIINFF